MKPVIHLIVGILLLLPQGAAALCVQGDCLNGQGTVVLPDGRRYVGEFQNGIRNGRGLMTFPDGTKYLGDWLNDKPHGQGTLSSIGKFEYAGEFANGVREGSGTLETVDGKKYVGQWQNDVPHGQGKITYPDNSTFTGEFENGRRNGQGEAVYADGTRYTGQWKDDLPNGQGTKIYVDGEQFKGEFRNGLMHGQGTVMKADGSSYTGQWQNDVLVSREEVVRETEFATVDENAGHVLAVVDEKRDEIRLPVETGETKAEPETPVPAAEMNMNISRAGYASVSQNGVFVRSGPSTEYRIIRSVSRGFPVQLIGQEGDWSNIRDSVGQQGWIYATLLGPNNSVIVNVSKANVRSGPGLAFSVVSQIDFGTVLQVGSIQNDWYMVTTPGNITGWLHRELIWPTENAMVESQESAGPENETGQEIVIAGEAAEQPESLEQAEAAPAEQRDVPGIAGETASQPVQQAIEPEAVEAIPPAGEAVAVSAAERVVASGKNYVGVVLNGKGANIRSEPSLAAEVLRSVPPGYPMAVLERRADWVFVVDFRERQGWIYASLLTDIQTVVIKVGKGNLRSGPDLTNEITAKLDYGAVMFVDETSGEWVKVSNPDGITGWLHRDIVWP